MGGSEPADGNLMGALHARVEFLWCDGLCYQVPREVVQEEIRYHRCEPSDFPRDGCPCGVGILEGYLAGI